MTTKKRSVRICVVEHLGSIVAPVSHGGVGRDHLHLVRVERMEGIQRKAGIFFPVGGKPAVVVPQFENGCKAGVNALTCSLGLGSDNGKRFKVSAVGLLPVVPQTGEGERHCCWVGNSEIEDTLHRLCSFGRFDRTAEKIARGVWFINRFGREGRGYSVAGLRPFIKAISWDKAAPSLEGFAPSRSFQKSRSAGEDGGEVFELLGAVRKEGNEPPSHQCEFPIAGVAIVADDRLMRRRGDVVVPRRQDNVIAMRDVECLSDLLFVRASVVAATHDYSLELVCRICSL